MSSEHDETSHDPVDAHVGDRVRLRRTLLGMSQGQLAGALSVTVKQMENHECGSQPIAAFRLWEIAKILDVPVDYFFEED